MGLGRFCSNFTPIFIDIGQQWVPADSGHTALATGNSSPPSQKKSYKYEGDIIAIYTS